VCALSPHCRPEKEQDWIAYTIAMLIFQHGIDDFHLRDLAITKFSAVESAATSGSD
jgi:hypothetical protein